MKYLVILTHRPDTIPDVQAYIRYFGDLAERGVLRGMERLDMAQPFEAFTRDGQVVPTDGPFAEAREILGGTFVLEVADADQAREIAALCPAVDTGTVTMFPCMGNAQAH